MALSAMTRFSNSNRRQLGLLVFSHLLWCLLILGLWLIGSLIGPAPAWLSIPFMAVQLYAAAQLLLPAAQLLPEKRSRGFYLFWGIALVLIVWLANLSIFGESGSLLQDIIRSGLLLFVATLVGSVLARYIQRLWEIIPICIIMALADFSSWLFGPTDGFTLQIQRYYLHPQGARPLIDMALVKLAIPGASRLVPVFGVSDWIMVVFFVMVSTRFAVNDHLFGRFGEKPVRVGRFLPVSVVALFISIQLAQMTGLFIPALPFIALIMLLWYAACYLRQRRTDA